MNEETAEEQSLDEPTFEQLVDEVDRKNNAAQETPYIPYDTEEPTPPRDLIKGKEAITEEPKNKLVAYVEEGGSDPKPLNLKPFINPDGTLI
nr:hypothetical protein [Tanacetum cinerariifolium]